jgi:hypothetical protein
LTSPLRTGKKHAEITQPGTKFAAIIAKEKQNPPQAIQGGHKMERKQAMKEAMRILMMSPLYFQLPLPARKVLVDEFCRTYAS